MLYRSICFRPRVTGCTLELAGDFFVSAVLFCVQNLYHGSGQALVKVFFIQKPCGNRDEEDKEEGE